MKPFLPLASILLLLCSCTEYQYLTVSGANLAKNAQNELVSENDTLKVQYHFTDYKGRMEISIFNKTGEPLEIDWRKSAVIVGGKAFSYYNPNADINATISKDSLYTQNVPTHAGDPLFLANVHGSIYINEPTQFIPPTSFISKVPLALPLTPIQDLPEAAKTKAVAQGLEDAGVNYKRLEFAEAASPVRFRSYLTFHIGSGSAQKEFTLEHSFFVSELWKSTSSPENFPSGLVNRNDRFYLTL